MTTHYSHCSTLRIVLLALLGVAAAPPGRYEFSNTGVVRDTRTMLIWQRTVDTTKRTHADAMTYCEQLMLAGLAWRLPTRAELSTLVDPTETGPAIDRTAFPETPSEQFWTSTLLSSARWTINFRDGSSGRANAPHYVRCVQRR